MTGIHVHKVIIDVAASLRRAVFDPLLDDSEPLLADAAWLSRSSTVAAGA